MTAEALAVLVTVLLLVGVAPARAQVRVLPAGEGTGAPIAEPVRRVIDSATALAIPSAPLLAKAREGALKGAPAPRVEQAVRALKQRLVVARQRLGPDASDAELVAAADALQAGASADEVGKVAAMARGGRAVVALGVLAQLGARGVPTARATEAIVGLLARNASGRHLAAFGADVDADVAGGMAPLGALDVRRRRLSAALPTLSPGAGSAATPVIGGGAAK